jgi:putative sterol carrier protein
MAGKRTPPRARRDATDAFFEELATRGHEPVLHNVAGSVRLDITGDMTEHYVVTIDRGAVRVSSRAAVADATVRADRSVFNRMAEGRMNAMAALLRGVLVIDGDLNTATSFIRVLPGPPDSLTSFAQRQEARAND